MNKLAYLTFDDGPSPNTAKILKILNLYGIKATFFVVGREGQYEKELYRKIAADGHSIGNHTFSHEYAKIYSSIEAFKEDFYALEKLLVEEIGFKPEIMRFPGGSNNKISQSLGPEHLMHQLAKNVSEEGYSYFDWNVDSRDSSAYLVDFGTIVEAVLEGARDKERAVILLHDAPVKTTTVNALPEIIMGLTKLGYDFAALSRDILPCRFNLGAATMENS